MFPATRYWTHVEYLLAMIIWAASFLVFADLEYADWLWKSISA